MLQICLDCTAAYSVGAPRCPQCGSADWAEEGTEAAMPKITVHGGPTNAADLPADPAPGGAMPAFSDEEREHPGTGEPGEAIEASPDGVEREIVVAEPKPAPPKKATAAAAKPEASKDA